MTSLLPGSHYGSSWTAGLTLSAGAGDLDAQRAILVGVNPTGFSAGSYTGSVTIFTDKGGYVVIPVTFVIQTLFSVAPGSLSYTFQQGTQPPGEQALTVSTQPVAGTPFTASAVQNPGESWLLLNASQSAIPATIVTAVNPAGLAPGLYSAGIAIASPNSVPVTVPVTLTVNKSILPPILAVPAGAQSFSLARTDDPAYSQVTVSNSGGGVLQYAAQVTQTPGNWLTLNRNGAGSATALSPSAVGFSLNAAALNPGVYTGQITVQDLNSSAKAQVGVILAVNTSAQTLTLSQTAMTFTALAGGAIPPARTVTIGTAGSGPLSWTAKTQALVNAAAASGNWLNISAAEGSTASGPAGSTLYVSADPTGLPAGHYYGSVNISAGAAANSPQTISVMLSVGATVDLSLSSGGLLFSAASGSSPDQRQSIAVFNPAKLPVSYSTLTSPTSPWLSVSPASGSLLPGSNILTISADFTALPPGVQTAGIQLSFDTGATGTIQARAISTGTGFNAAVCVSGKPSVLLPVFQKPAGGVTVQASVAQSVQAQIRDDCGHSLTERSGGSAEVVFSNGDPPVDLHDTGSGVWEGTWNPGKSGSAVTLGLAAVQQTAGLGGSADPVTVKIAPADSSGPPQIWNVVNAASSAVAIPQVVAPGSYVAIYGAGLASVSNPISAAVPLNNALNGTQVLLGGAPLPLVYAGPSQINALISQDVTPYTLQQMVVIRGETQSIPVSLATVAFQPAIYSQDLSGQGQGVVEVVGSTLLAAPAGNSSRPAVRGRDYLAAFCTGLGPVVGARGELPPADGAAASPSVLYRTTYAVTATLGGAAAPVVFSGLTPTLVGLYQVNIEVPPGAPVGTAIPLTLSVNDIVGNAVYQSNTVTVAVE